jgi:hypothetical protein
MAERHAQSAGINFFRAEDSVVFNMPVACSVLPAWAKITDALA